MTDEELFDGKCPYTDRPCTNAWDCANCEVETEERLWAEDCDNDCEHCEWVTCRGGRMTVAELIEKLEQIEDKSKKVYVYSYDDWTPATMVCEDDDIDYGYKNSVGII